MKKIISLSTIAMILMFSMVLFISCIPKPEFIGRKVIVSNLGEVTHDTRYAGEVIRYKIYYQSKSSAKSDVTITDKLDTNLSDIKVFNNGKYDEPSHSVAWEIKDVAGGTEDFVEFEGTIGKTDVITDKATIQPKGAKQFETNIVEAKICPDPDLGWIPFITDAKPEDRPKKVLKDETTTGTMIYFEMPGMFVREVNVEGRIYHKISIPTLSLLNDIGKPELPIIGKAVEIPRDVKISLEIKKSDTVTFDCYNVFPAQMPEPEQAGGAKEEFIIDPATYTKDALYPDKPAFIEAQDDAIIRGHRIIFPKASPIRFNPVTKELVAYKSIEIRVKYDTPAQIEAIDDRLISPVFEDILDATVENLKADERFEESEAGPGDHQQGCDYLVITPSAFYNASDANNPIRQLCEWKHRKGLMTRVETIENIGNTAANIINFMQNAYDTWNPVPTYVVLIGDTNHIVPEYRTNHPDHGTNIGTDLYYATLDGTDYFPDVILSRISVDDATDVRNIIDKILLYEQNPPANANFYTNTSLVRLFEDDDPVNGTEDNIWVLIERAEEMRDFLINEGYTADRIYNFSGGYAGDPLTGDPAGPQRWENGTPLPNELTQQPPVVFQWNGNTNDIANAFNNGNFMVTYRGHGGMTGWSRPSFRIANLGLLNQNNMTPAVFCPTCQAGWFDHATDDCFAEEILELDGRGAIGVIASSRNSWGAYNNPMLEGMCDALWPDFDTAISAGYLPRLGQIITYCKTYMAQNVAATNNRLISFEMTHLFGDPELPIWTEEPGVMDVDHPEGIGSTGKQDFVVKVTDQNTNAPVQSAVVALTRSSGIISVVQTDFGGDAYFSVTNVGAGDIDITVTSLKYRPYTGKISAIANGAVINILNPEDGTTGQDVYIGGQNFSGSEQVDIYFGLQLVKTVSASSGSFGQSNDVFFKVPAIASVGPVTIMAKGKTSGRYATELFKVRTANSVELYIYSQWDNTTWTSYPGNHPVWNNPEIWLEDSATGNPVASNNLVINNQYTIKARIYNSSNNDANAVRVTFKWANFGAGQQVWTDIGNAPPINVAKNNSNIAQIDWKPTKTGHTCVIAQIYHAEDIRNENNVGQENCHVGTTTSPAIVEFQVCNPMDYPAMVFLELRQIGIENNEQGAEEVIWGSMIEHPDPQLLMPGECRTARVIIDPDLATSFVNSGQIAKFALTAFINGKMVGGTNFEIQKK